MRAVAKVSLLAKSALVIFLLCQKTFVPVFNRPR